MIENYLVLFFEFFKIGLFAVGGGYATLPFLYGIAGKYSWLSSANIPNMLAVSQLLPGAIGVNLAAYTGTHLSAAGAYIAVLGMIAPQVTIIILIAGAYDAFNKNKIVQGVFKALSPAAAGLLCSACLGIWKQTLLKSSGKGTVSGGWHFAVDYRALAIFIVIYILFKKTNFHPAIFILLGGVIGVVLGL